MKVINAEEVIPVVMNNDRVKNVSGRVLIGKADGADNFCMRMFEVGRQGHTPRHSHEWEHEIFVHGGRGKVFIEDQWHEMAKGTAVFIPANVEHQIQNTGDSPLTFICLVPPSSPEM